jgi:hypothetical protein
MGRRNAIPISSVGSLAEAAVVRRLGLGAQQARSLDLAAIIYLARDQSMRCLTVFDPSLHGHQNVMIRIEFYAGVGRRAQ